MNFLVTGARGMLGTEVVAALSDRGRPCRGVDLDEVDITDAGAVSELLSAEGPDVLINCAAYTAVDRAEADEHAAALVNATAVGYLAAAARAVGAVLVHFSTDFVFDGRRREPYGPHDVPRPLSAYGRTKLAGEQAVQRSGCEHLIIRTSWLYGAAGPNFVSAILGRARRGEPLRIVSDQVGRPTWARNLAEATLDLVDARARGVFHVTDGGAPTSWHDFGCRALQLADLDVPVEPVTGAEWGAPAFRPAYSVLDLTETEDLLGRNMEPWEQALRRYLEG
ncbi:MAG: dTDP-4-dehydrorhamnose reductase [Longimicrobiales bacterium]